MTKSLSVQGLFAGYGRTTILKDVSIEVATGERHVVIGPNGAGKTTFFRSLCGEVPAMAGRILFEGRDVTALSGFRRVRAGIGRSFQVARIFGEMNPVENVVVAIEARAQETSRGLPSLRSARGRKSATRPKPC